MRPLGRERGAAQRQLEGSRLGEGLTAVEEVRRPLVDHLGIYAGTFHRLVCVHPPA